MSRGPTHSNSRSCSACHPTRNVGAEVRFTNFAERFSKHPSEEDFAGLCRGLTTAFFQNEAELPPSKRMKNYDAKFKSEYALWDANSGVRRVHGV